jgi:hypothetical protein
MNTFWLKLTANMSPSAVKSLAIFTSVLAGLILSVVVHYVLYRIGLPSKPFIYVAF